MLDNIGTVSTIMAILVSIVGLGILGAAGVILSEEGPGAIKDPLWRRIYATGTKTSIAAILLVFIATFTPSTKQMATIIVAPAIINAVAENKQIQELPGSLVELANEWVEALKPKSEEEKKE